MTQLSDRQMRRLIEHLKTQHRISSLRVADNNNTYDDAEELLLFGGLQTRIGNQIMVKLVLSTEAVHQLLDFLDHLDNFGM